MGFAKLSLKSMSLGERIVLSARMAAQQHLMGAPEDATEAMVATADTGATRQRQTEIGGADRQRVTEDPTPSADARDAFIGARAPRRAGFRRLCFRS